MGKKKAVSCARALSDLEGVGPATVKDLHLLGIRGVPELAASEPERLYERLVSLVGSPVDICCLDVFRCAIEQARDPDLPPERRKWWYWSRLRKDEETSG